MTTINRRALLTAGASLAGLGILAACASNESATDTAAPNDEGVTKLVVGASPVPHAKILQFIKDNLAEDAKLDIEIVEYTDYILPNKDLASGDLNANFYQTPNFLASEIDKNGYKFTAGNGVHIEPLGIYSEKVKSIDEIADGSEIAVNNDPSNTSRALKLIESAGLIKLKELGENELANQESIVENPKNLTFTELDGAQIPRSLGDFAAGVINGNFALEAGLVPNEDAIFLEPGEGSPYANLLVWRTEDDGNAAIQKLEELLHTPEVKKFIEENYTDGSVLPAF